MFSNPLKKIVSIHACAQLGFISCFLLLAWPSVARPCSCASQSDRDFDPLELPLIFVGKVATLETSRSKTVHGDVRNYTKACLDSEFSAHGVPPGNRRVCVATSTGSCAIDFSPGQHYLVYAGESGDGPPDAGVLYTDKCFGTTLVRGPEIPESRSSPAVPMLLTALLGFIAGVLVRALRRKA